MENQYQENPKERANDKVSAEGRLPTQILAYKIAQKAMADLKTAVYFLIAVGPSDGYTNADIGRKLGIYAGHVGHEGHISRTVLGMLESEGILQQIPETKYWQLKK